MEKYSDAMNRLKLYEKEACQKEREKHVTSYGSPYLLKKFLRQSQTGYNLVQYSGMCTM